MKKNVSGASFARPLIERSKARKGPSGLDDQLQHSRETDDRAVVATGTASIAGVEPQPVAKEAEVQRARPWAAEIPATLVGGNVNPQVLVGHEAFGHDPEQRCDVRGAERQLLPTDSRLAGVAGAEASVELPERDRHRGQEVPIGGSLQGLDATADHLVDADVLRRQLVAVLGTVVGEVPLLPDEGERMLHYRAVVCDVAVGDPTDAADGHDLGREPPDTIPSAGDNDVLVGDLGQNQVGIHLGGALTLFVEGRNRPARGVAVGPVGNFLLVGVRGDAPEVLDDREDAVLKHTAAADQQVHAVLADTALANRGAEEVLDLCNLSFSWRNLIRHQLSPPCVSPPAFLPISSVRAWVQVS